MAWWHFQKGGTATTCQHWLGNTRLDAKREGYSPPGDWWCCQCSLILRGRANWEGRETLSRAGKGRETMADNEKQPGKGRELTLWQLMVLGLTPSPSVCWSCDLSLIHCLSDHGTSLKGSSDVSDAVHEGLGHSEWSGSLAITVPGSVTQAKFFLCWSSF